MDARTGLSISANIRRLEFADLLRTYPHVPQVKWANIESLVNLDSWEFPICTLYRLILRQPAIRTRYGRLTSAM
jgi:hypothetical protein